MDALLELVPAVLLYYTMKRGSFRYSVLLLHAIVEAVKFVILAALIMLQPGHRRARLLSTFHWMTLVVLIPSAVCDVFYFFGFILVLELSDPLANTLLHQFWWLYVLFAKLLISHRVSVYEVIGSLLTLGGFLLVLNSDPHFNKFGVFWWCLGYPFFTNSAKALSVTWKAFFLGGNVGPATRPAPLVIAAGSAMVGAISSALLAIVFEQNMIRHFTLEDLSLFVPLYAVVAVVLESAYIIRVAYKPVTGWPRHLSVAAASSLALLIATVPPWPLNANIFISAAIISVGWFQLSTANKDDKDILGRSLSEPAKRIKRTESVESVRHGDPESLLAGTRVTQTEDIDLDTMGSPGVVVKTPRLSVSLVPVDDDALSDIGDKVT
ncbi:hypothetical protein J8273_2813 [Carpediemonas membranifera]|uniref:Transmembrane protein n=1 Tax=Carpediemonas membranifera TaxID=201153 RepID=A0A8J6E387_9EUKA|nr:hypothetical protein J8273_2813 [Carpediemonas membranifera]|eukprot:KAG9395618.1 hypothetical protein J8273_2813 [Carpediemonas membranifera]